MVAVSNSFIQRFSRFAAWFLHYGIYRNLCQVFAELIYNGFWFAPERLMLQAAIDRSQDHVSGSVRLRLYKGSCAVTARRSPHSLYSQAHVTFEDDTVYDQRDAEGFIRLNALRLRLARRRGEG